MYQNLRQAGANSSEQTTLPTGLQVGLGTRAVATSRNFSAGQPAAEQQPARPGRSSGNGFFQVQMPDGTTGYTRDGSFQVDAQGQLVTNNGYPVQPGITIPANAQSVTDRRRRHGQRHAAGPGAAADGRASCSWPASSTRPAWSRKGQNLYAETAASGTPERRRAGRRTAWAALQQGFVETSQRQRGRGAGRR